VKTSKPFYFQSNTPTIYNNQEETYGVTYHQGGFLMKVLFIEPPREFWFVMGEYLPPPFGLVQLAAYFENKVENADIEVVDCTAQKLSWSELRRKIESFHPDVVAASAYATCNVYLVVRTLEISKNVNSEILTVTGGQHFTATAQESLETYPEIDVIVRGEGEETLTELVKTLPRKSQFPQIRGISFRHDGKILHTKPRPLIKDLNEHKDTPGIHYIADYEESTRDRFGRHKKEIGVSSVIAAVITIAAFILDNVGVI